MPQVWFLDDKAGWCDTPLIGDGLEIANTKLLPARHGFVSVPTLWRVADGGRAEKWVLVGPPATRLSVNGETLVGGIRVLEDRDLIQIENGPRLFYTTDGNAVVAPLPDLGRKAICPRCKTEIRVGTPAVQCPACRTFHHQDESKDLLCWTYAEQCSNCDCHTDLSLDLRWSPEDL